MLMDSDEFYERRVFQPSGLLPDCSSLSRDGWIRV